MDNFLPPTMNTSVYSFLVKCNFKLIIIFESFVENIFQAFTSVFFCYLQLVEGHSSQILWRGQPMPSIIYDIA